MNLPSVIKLGNAPCRCSRAIELVESRLHMIRDYGFMWRTAQALIHNTSVMVARGSE